MTGTVRPNVVRLAFVELDMHRIYVTTRPTSVASQRVLDKAGFRQEGILRQHSRVDDLWIDALMFGLLRSDSNSRSE